MALLTWPKRIAHRRGFEFGDALLEIGAAVAAEIGGLGGRIRICAHDYSDPGGSKQARS